MDVKCTQDDIEQQQNMDDYQAREFPYVDCHHFVQRISFQLVQIHRYIED